MTANTKTLMINIAASAVTACAVVFLSYGLTRSGKKADTIDSELKKKAPYDYVDMRDGEIKSDLKDYKIQQEQRHTSEMKEIDRKLDLILEVVKANRGK